MILKNSVRTLLFLLFVALISGCKKDSVPPADPPGPVWLQFTTANSSLLSNKIHCIFQDGEGTVWLGSDSGASGYNKKTWTLLKDSLQTIEYNNGSSSIRATVYVISQSQGGSLWFGTGSGVVRYNRLSSFKVWRRYTDQIPGVVNGVAGEMIQTGRVWIVSNLVGAARFLPSTDVTQDGSWTTFNASNSVLPNTITTVTNNLVENHFWFGTFADGIFRENDDGSFTPFVLPPEYNYGVNSLAFDLNGYAWVAKQDSGVSVLKIATNEWIHHYTVGRTNGLMPPGSISAVVTDLHSTRWFGTSKGVIQLKDSVMTLINHANSPELPDDAITALLYDGNGNLWIGTKQNGVVVYNPNGTRL